MLTFHNANEMKCAINTNWKSAYCKLVLSSSHFTIECPSKFLRIISRHSLLQLQYDAASKCALRLGISFNNSAIIGN